MCREAANKTGVSQSPNARAIDATAKGLLSLGAKNCVNVGEAEAKGSYTEVAGVMTKSSSFSQSLVSFPGP